MKKLYALLKYGLMLWIACLLAPAAMAQTQQLTQDGAISKAQISQSADEIRAVQKLRDQLINESRVLPAESPLSADWLNDIARLEALQAWLEKGHEAQAFPGRSAANTLELKSVAPAITPGLRPEVPIFIGEEIMNLDGLRILRPNNQQP